MEIFLGLFIGLILGGVIGALVTFVMLKDKSVDEETPIIYADIHEDDAECGLNHDLFADW